MSADGQGGPLLRWVFRGYQAILSPMLHAVSPTQCKFLPTCSEYAYVAIARHGIWLGSALALRRLVRCHPVSAGGFDPVPERKDAAKESSRPDGAGKIHHLS